MDIDLLLHRFDEVLQRSGSHARGLDAGAGGLQGAGTDGSSEGEADPSRPRRGGTPQAAQQPEEQNCRRQQQRQQPVAKYTSSGRVQARPQGGSRARAAVAAASAEYEQRQQEQQQQQQQIAQQAPRCFACGQVGHDSNCCPNW